MTAELAAVAAACTHVACNGQPSGKSSRERVYAAVVSHHRCHGYAPTVRELAAATGLAVSTVAYHLDGLVAADRLTRRPGLLRTVTPTPADRSS